MSAATPEQQEATRIALEPWGPIPHPYDLAVTRMRAAGCNQGAGNDWSCPNLDHEDADPSFGLTRGDDPDHPLLINCSCKCAPFARLRDSIPMTHEEFIGRRTTFFDWTDRDGVCRYGEKRTDYFDGRKSRRWLYHITSDGTREPGIKGVVAAADRFLYGEAGVERVAATGGRVLVVEGPKCAAIGNAYLDALEVDTVVFTCVIGSSSWGFPNARMLASLRGAAVAVWPDRDDASLRWAHTWVEALEAPGVEAKSVTAVWSRTTGKADDIEEHLREYKRLQGADLGVVEVPRSELERATSGAKSTATQDESAAGDTAGGTASKPTVAQQLTGIALQAYRFGQSDEGRAFAAPVDGPNIAREIDVKDSRLRAELSKAYRERTGKVANSAALGDAVTALIGEALDKPRETLALRLAQPEPGRIVIDLGDESGRVVKVTADGWRVLERSPVLFRRTRLTGGFPEPVRGDVSLLRPLLNVNDETFELLTGWLVAGFFPEIDHAALLLDGEPGTAKSTATKFLLRLIDPSPVETRPLPRDAEKWMSAAAGSWVVPIENLSKLSPAMSDVLCRAVTGDGFANRKLYTDDDLYVGGFRRVLLLNGIAPSGIRGDLADRMLRVDLEPIEAGARKELAELERDYAKIHPGVFGGLLDVLAGVLAVRRDGLDQLENLSRLADFERVLKAVDVVRGTHARQTYLTLTTRTRTDLAESDPLTKALRELLEPSMHQRFRGTATELLAKLPTLFSDRSLPRSANGLAGWLKRLAPALRESGWTVELSRSGNNKVWKIALPRPAQRAM